jgi:hypothetical protein
VATFDTVFYCNAGNQSSTGYYAVTKWATGATIAAGALRRQNTTPAVGSERVFIAIVGGTTNATTEPTWVVTRGGKTTDNTVTWQECTGASAVNGDATNTPTWAAAKAISSAITLGAIIKRANGASYWICSTAGSSGASEPAWANDTAGTTQTDGTVTWTCLGVVGNFSGGGAPHARLANVCAAAWFAPGNTIYVGDNHAESQTTAIPIQPILSQTLVGRIICHNHSGNYPPASADLATTATISTTAAAAINLNMIAGSIYIYGITFIAGVGQSSGAAVINFALNMAFCLCESCVFKLATTGVTAVISLNNSAGGVLIWNNCQAGFANAGQSLYGSNCFFTWQNTTQVLATGSTVPTNLFVQSGTGGIGNMTLETLDLSQWAAIFASLAANPSLGNWVIKDCKLNASATFPTPLQTGQTIQIVRADGGATAYRSARYAVEGTETTETSFTRVGGAADPTGQAQARKIATTANSQWLRPFKAEPYAIWNAVTSGNVTVTVYGTINAGALPNNDDIWLEVEYLGSSASPQGTIVNTTKANLFSANAAVASDSSSWNGGGSGAGWTPFKLTATLSSPQPQMAGYIEARVRVGKPSTTYYLDPRPVLS